jgi:hypothetical protein
MIQNRKSDSPIFFKLIRFDHQQYVNVSGDEALQCIS